jgi:UDP-glucose 4-epimerase
MLIHQSPNPVKPVRAVILGAGGFLAAEMQRVLESDGMAVRPVHPQEIDLTDVSAGDKVAALLQPDDSVVMPAGLTPDKGRDAATLMKNLRMAESVSEALGRSAVAHFIYISSDAVYDARFSSLLDEESTCEPFDLYALMHTARERMLSQACRQSRVPFTAVRPCAMYGDGDTHNSYGPNRFIRTACQEGKITLFGGGEEKRDHVFVRDTAEIVKLCFLHRSTGIINVATGQAVSFRDVAGMVMQALGRPVELVCLPRANPITHRYYDTTALVKAFPQFAPTALEAGIAQALRGMAPQ